MKKRLLWIFVLLLILLSACGKNVPQGEVTTAVTWEELLAANRLDAVLEQVDSFSSTTNDDGEETYINYVAMVDGKLMFSEGSLGYTEDFRDGILYDAPTDAMEKTITILAPTANPNDLVEGAYGETLKEYQTPEKIYFNENQYFASLYREDKEWGIVSEGYAYFDAETLLLDRVELAHKFGAMKYRQNAQMDYHIGTDFAMASYDNIVNAEDAVELTIHYPDGNMKEITVDRDVTVLAYYPNHAEDWSVCWDEACTESIDHLGWINGNRGDVYLYEGYVPPAPPPLSRVLEKSSFEAMFRENYDTYFQNTYITDENDNTLKIKDLAWYMDEEVGLCLNFEVKDGDYTVVQSGRARDGAWYSWSEDTGYAVDFYDDFSYAEDLVREHRLFLYEEQLGAPLEMGEEGYAYYIPYTETVGEGITNEYRYWIHPDFDSIDRVEITRKNAEQNIIGYVTCYISGNGPIAGDLDIFAEISAPDEVEIIEVTVVSSNGEKPYFIRNDAAISWKGNALYRDEACTEAISDLSWVDGNKAKVYVK